MLNSLADKACSPQRPSWGSSKGKASPSLQLTPAEDASPHPACGPGELVPAARPTQDVITFRRLCLSVLSLFLGASSTSASSIGSCVLFVWFLFFPFKLPWNGDGGNLHEKPSTSCPLEHRAAAQRLQRVAPAAMGLLKPCSFPQGLSTTGQTSALSKWQVENPYLI